MNHAPKGIEPILDNAKLSVLPLDDEAIWWVFEDLHLLSEYYLTVLKTPGLQPGGEKKTHKKRGEEK